MSARYAVVVSLSAALGGAEALFFCFACNRRMMNAPPEAAKPGRGLLLVTGLPRAVAPPLALPLCGSRRPPLLAPLLPACAARLTALGAAHAPLLTPLGAGCAPLLTSLRARLCARRRGANRRGGRRAGLLGLSLRYRQDGGRYRRSQHGQSKKRKGPSTRDHFGFTHHKLPDIDA